MVRDYMVTDTEGRMKLHWISDANDDWAEFLLHCRKNLKSGVYKDDYKILIAGHEYGKVGELL